MNIILFLLFIFILVYDVKKGIIIYAPFKLFFIGGYELLGKIEFDFAFSIIAFITYIGKYGINKKMRVPWLIGVLVATIAYIANSLYPLYHPLIALRDTFSVYLYSLIYFAAIEKEHRRLALNSIILVFVLLIGNGLIEYLTRTNILGDFQKTYVYKGVFISEIDVERLGIHRTKSFIPHSIGFGVVCACFLYLFFLCTRSNRKISRTDLVLMFLSVFGVIISGSRSPLLGLPVMFLPLLFSSQLFKVRNIILFLLIFAFVIIISGSYVTNIIMSLDADTRNTSTAVSGSSFEMRINQLNFSIFYWLKKPIWGWGATARMLEMGDRNEIYGGESVWFMLMMKRGIVGMASYIYLYISIFWSIRHMKIRRFIYSFMAGWLVIDTATNLPGINFFFPLMIITVVYKYRKEIVEKSESKLSINNKR